MAVQNALGMAGIGTGVSDLGFGSNLVAQRKQETEEERKKRLLGLSSATPAVTSLFGLGGVGAGRAS